MPSKGRQSELDAKDAYEAAGYRVYHPPKAKYREQDVFGLFDLWSYHPQVGFVGTQIKTNRAQGINAFFESAEPFREAENVRVEFLVRHEGDGWRLAEATEGGYEWVYDDRDDGNGELAEGLTSHIEP